MDSFGIIWQFISASLTRGTVYNQYIGNEVLPTSFRVQYLIAMGPGVGPISGDGMNAFRVLVY